MDIINDYLHANQSLFIDNASDLMNKLNFKGDFLAALKLILAHNEKLFTDLKSQNQDLSQKERQYLANLNNQIPSLKVINEESVCLEIVLETQPKVNITKYLQAVLASQSSEDIDTILPDKTAKNYAVILKTLLMKLKAEINVIRKLINDGEEFSAKELEDINTQYRILVDCFNRLVINNQSEIIECEEIEEESLEKNKLWFLTTEFECERGCCFISDLKKRIPEEYYQTFSNMIKKLRKGYNRNDFDISNFENDATLKQILEVKNTNGSRLFFYNLGNQNIIILGGYIKRQQKEKRLKQLLNARYDIFINQKQEIINSLEDPDYIIRQMAFEAEISNYLPLAEVNDKGVKHENR